MLKSVRPCEVAVVGYACRLPGAPDADAFWTVLESGRCTVTEVQPDRWPLERWGHAGTAAGRSYTFAAGQLDAPFAFDPGFFGISPREAEQMDPQQRLLLEVAWEALEKAGMRASELPKATTGVFVGASSSDYSNRFFMDPAAIDAQFMTGNTLSLISNRLSYIFDLHGPSYTVDTACSSGLYALHEAFTAMQAGLVDTALVGGVNMLLSPFPFIGFSRATMLSRHGLCRAFDADGDGYVRSEGAVVFVLRTLEAALASHDRILGVISGAGINSDGRTTGVSLPSAERQQALLEDVYQRFDVDPERLSFVEAHGTGTRAGDPLETHALGQALGKRRTAPLPIGSAKTNVGHLEAGSGLVGLLKAQLALEKGVIPASLHFRTPNPDIDFDGLNLRVAAEPEPLPAQAAPHMAGVNSFGFGGANAHVVIRQARAEERRAAPGPVEPAPLILSARSEESLTALARAWRDRLDGANAAEAARLANAAAHQRERLPHRLVALPRDRADQIAALDGWLAGGKTAAVATGRAATRPGATVFAFSGNGAQFVGMGRAAYARDPIFRAKFDAVSTIFAQLAEVDLVAAIHDPDLEARLSYTSLAQPLIFAVQVATVESLGEKGLKPDAVIGHSVGEVAAAWAAGAFDLPDAVRLIHVRSRSQERIRGHGTMAAVLAGADPVRALLAEGGFAELCLAAENSPRSVTISGPEAEIDAFAKLARGKRIAVKRLGLDYPFHAPAAETMREGLLADLTWLRPQETRCAFISATFGEVMDGEALGPHYWWSNIRQPVLFRQGLDAALALDAACFVEVGPRPVLTTYLRDTVAERARPAAVLTALEEKDPAPDLRRVVAQALTQGARIVETRFFGRDARVDEDLPAYPWKHQTYRAEPSDEALDPFAADPRANPLLGAEGRSGARDWRAVADAGSPAWLADHKVGGAVVFPASGHADLALSAGLAALGEGAVELVGLDILRALTLDEGGGTELRTRLAGDRLVADVESRRRLSGDAFALHARGRLRRPAGPAPTPRPAPAADPARTLAAEALYALTRRFGLDYGPAFRRVQAVQIIGAAEAYVRLSPCGPDLAPERHALHPAALDAAFHGLFALLADRAGAAGDAAAQSFLPVRLGRLTLLVPRAPVTGAWIEITRASARGVEARFTLAGPDGAVVAQLDGARFKAVRLARPRAPADLAYRNALVRLPAPDGARSALGAALPAALAGVTAVEPPEPGAGALLLDTAARRVARDVLAGMGTEIGLIDPAAWEADGRLSPVARPLLERLLHALEEDEALSRTEDGKALLAPEAPYPPLSALVEALFAEAPRRIVEIARLMAVPDALPRLLAEGLDGADEATATAAHLRQAAAGPAGEARWAALGAAFEAAAAAAGPRFAVLVAGAAPAGLLDRIAAARPARAVVTDPDPRRLRALEVGDAERPGLSHVPLTDLDETEGFDLVLIGDALSRMSATDLAELRCRMAPGGALAAVEDAPNLLADLIEGQEAEWWSDTFDPMAPLGRLRDGAEWAAVLAEAGFADVQAAPLASAEAQANLILAAAPEAEGAADRPRPHDPVWLLHGAQGAALAEAAAAALAPRPARALPLDGLAAALTASEGPVELVLLPDAGAPTDGPALPRAHARILAARAALGQPARLSRLWLVARGAVAAGPLRPLDPAEAALWGLARTLSNEAPDLDLRLVDLARDLPDAALAPRLAAELARPDAEREVVLDALGRAGVRVQRLPDLAERAARAALPPEGGMTRLALGQQGAIDSLGWQVAPRAAPEGAQVEIEVTAAGLNFRDIMWAQGLLPEEALEDGFAGPTLGMECSGTVVRAGPGAARFRPGDRVIAFAPACFASHVTVAEAAVAPLPPGVDLTAAATIPTAFLTAWYALVELARLAPGETVLIHGGAGGVGLAALQIAAAQGATVFATAGSPAKRELLHRLGAAQVFDSRSLDFAEQVMAATGGQGVDVVLNSLFGEAMERSLDCLRPFGRFVELGKRDYYADSQLGLRPFRRNLTYFGVDADQLLVHRPETAARVFEALGEGFARGDLIPLPHLVFDPAEVTDAFRLMQKSGHVGKIVIRAPAAPAPLAPAAPARLRDACLVVGGLGGFGAETAAWAVERGARQVWLTSRSGRVTEPARAAIRRMEAMGAKVVTRACDAADEGAMRALIDEIEAGPARLRAVLHTAMTLDDALFANLDAERIRTVLRPKVAGAEVLDRLTRDRALDHFVLFSSATTLIGNPGQASYVAANAALEALAAERRRAGLPGLAVAWGAISDAGYLTRDAKTGAILADRMGGQAITAHEALAGLDLALAGADPADASATAYAQIDWAAARRELALTATPLFARMILPEGQGGAEGAADLLAQIAGLSEAEALARIAGLLAAETSRILRLPVEEIDPRQPLTDMGFDSLMAVDLRMAAEEKLGLDIPLMSLAGGATLMDIAGRVLKRLGAADAVEADADADMAALVARHVDAEGQGALDADTIGEMRRRAEAGSRALH